MDETTTSALLDVLKNAEIKDMRFLLNKSMAVREISFVSYMDKLIEKKDMKRRDILQRADIPQKYGYKLLTEECRTRDRDKLLRIFFAMHCTLDEVQRGLALYGMPQLYPKRRRDAILIIALNRGLSSVDAVNAILLEQGEVELSRSRDA